MSDYDRISKAISFIVERVREQPSLDEIAAHIHMSPFHFQRIFSRWAGVTPKRFLQVLTLERSKHLLDQSMPLLEVSDSIGLSSGSRLYDHFIQIESVTPGEYKKKGKDLTIEYGVHPSPFGNIFVAFTPRGVCQAAFMEYSRLAEQIANLEASWPQAQIRENSVASKKLVTSMFESVRNGRYPLSLHVAGTNFQVAVWKALMRIPAGSVVSYSQVAESIGRPAAARAVGSAIAENPVAFLIPCHRVIQKSGALGEYHWGQTRKHAIQMWEAAQLDSETP